MIASRRILSAALLGLILTLTLGGCGSTYSSSVTPELDSYADTDTQDYNRYARVVDNNTRQMWDDLANVLLINNTSSLTKYPVRRW